MPIKKICFVLTLVVLIFSAVMVFHATTSSADELDDINKQLSDLNDQLNKSVAATKPVQSELDNIQKQMASIKVRVGGIEADSKLKRKQIDEGYKDMVEKQKIISQTIREFYVQSYYNTPLLTFLSFNTASRMTQALAYQKAKTEQDKATITNIALTINDLEQKKQQLEQEETFLVSAKASLDSQSQKLDKVVKDALAFQSSLSGQISALSTKQQSLLAAKLGSLNIPLFAYSTQGGCSSDLSPYKDPGFSGPKFGLFTYGVPNRVGLNQYGRGRAKAGQDEDAILHAYYSFDSYDTSSYTGTQIKVNDSNGYDSGNIIWTGSLDDYVKRIYEVPDSWADNNLAALKAQAVAARSYVLAETNNGAKSICASNQNCQVFKTDPKEAIGNQLLIRQQAKSWCRVASRLWRIFPQRTVVMSTQLLILAGVVQVLPNGHKTQTGQ